MPRRLLTAARPIVHYVLREHRVVGHPVEHLVWMATMAGILTGAGLHPMEAIASVERLQRQGRIPGDGREPAWFLREEARRLARAGYPVPERVEFPATWQY